MDKKISIALFFYLSTNEKGQNEFNDFTTKYNSLNVEEKVKLINKIRNSAGIKINKKTLRNTKMSLGPKTKSCLVCGK